MPHIKKLLWIWHCVFSFFERNWKLFRKKSTGQQSKGEHCWHLNNCLPANDCDSSSLEDWMLFGVWRRRRRPPSGFCIFIDDVIFYVVRIWLALTLLHLFLPHFHFREREEKKKKHPFRLWSQYQTSLPAQRGAYSRERALMLANLPCNNRPDATNYQYCRLMSRWNKRITVHR